jgi:uncharacterized membrane protein YgaE (UPF0421/DUF939 family)
MNFQINIKKYLLFSVKSKSSIFCIYFQALSSLLMTLAETGDNLPCTEEFAFLSELLQKPELHSLVHIHNKVLASTNSRDGRFNPVADSSVQAALEALADVLPLIEQPKKSLDSRQAGQELLNLLQTPHIQVWCKL